MRYDLKTPCKNCPFRTDETRIRFASRGRAEEIEEHAYRHGFPCHKSAVVLEEDELYEGSEGGFVPGDNTQHCVGYILLQLHENGGSGWPGINNDDDLAEKLSQQVDWGAPVFTSTEDFFEANEELPEPPVRKPVTPRKTKPRPNPKRKKWVTRKK